MRALVIGAVVAALAFTSAVLAQTLIGNCGAGITGIQLSTGNVYCMPAPSGCTPTGLDFTNACNSQYITVI